MIERLPTALTAVVAVALAAAGLYGIAQTAPHEGYDGAAHVAYAQVLADEGRLPTEAESYEFGSPPAYHALAVALEALTGTWRAAQGLSLLWTFGLLAATALLARELWPGQPARWMIAALLTAALPIVLRIGVMFHPEAQHAALAAVALWLTARASRRGWPVVDGALLGAVLGAAALTRQSAAAVTAAIGLAVLLAGRRDAVRFAAAAAAALLVLAGPWWAYQADRYGNPLESNLDRYTREGGYPRSFYVSAPLRDLVVHPYRPAFEEELWPKFHADLWSDWFGGQHDYWHEEPSASTRVAVSAQSVLGLVFTPIALTGLVAFGVAGLRHHEAAWAALLAVALVSWVAFVVQLIRFPQVGGDPIKSSYMLYLAPVFAVASVAAGKRLWQRGGAWRFGIVLWAGLYAVSYAAFLLTSWP